MPTRTVCMFLLALSVLLLEVAFTRIFSFISFHHFTYLVISVAMLGFGAAGSYLTLRGERDATLSGNEYLARHAALFGFGTILAISVIPFIRFSPMDLILNQEYIQLSYLMLIVLLTAVPFYLGGVCIGTIIGQAGVRINQVYFADLTGAASGSLLSILFINTLGAVATCFAAAAIALLVAALLTASHRRVFILAVLVSVALTLFVYRFEIPSLSVPTGKQMYSTQDQVELVKWHIITRLDVTRPIEGYFGFGGGLSRRYIENSGEPQLVRFIYQDGSNLTGIIQPTPTPAKTFSLGYYLQAAPYQARSGARVLVIGCGGGVDVLIALYHHASHVVCVDINPRMIELVRNEYNDFAGGVFRLEDVEPVVSEGRHFLSRDLRKFDVIQLSGVDTWSALTTGANALTENFIYTSEAFDQYLSHLQPDGIVNFSRPFLATETPKLALTAIEALERLGVEDPASHLMIIAETGKPAGRLTWSQTLVKRSAFSREEVEGLENWANYLEFEMIYDPFTPRGGELEALIRAIPEERARLVSENHFDIRPAKDDRPFFFQFYRWRDILPDWNDEGKLAQSILLISILQVALLSGVFIFVPLNLKRIPVAKAGGRTGIFIYFASLGLGFIIIEIALLQKFMVFLGGPAYAMAITLFTLLLTSGMGSYLSRNMAARPFRLLLVIIPALVLAILLYATFLDGIINALMPLSQFGRGLAAVLLVAPLGLLMGMPFPAGLRHVDSIRPDLTPWAWGVNAFATVVGSGICILISSSLGLRAALCFGAGIYFFGWRVFTLSQRKFKSLTVAS